MKNTGLGHEVDSCCRLNDTALGQVLCTQGVAARHDQADPVSLKLATTPDFGVHFSPTEEAEQVDT